LLLIASAVILIVVGYRPFPPSVWGKAATFFELSLVFLVLILAMVRVPLANAGSPDEPAPPTAIM